MAIDKTKLHRFTELNYYKLHEEEPHILNWEVLGNDVHIGVVDDLIVDLEQKKAVYIEVDLLDQHQSFNERPLFILIPVEKVWLNQKEKTALFHFLDKWNIESYPSYSQKLITAEYEYQLKNHLQALYIHHEQQNVFLKEKQKRSQQILDEYHAATLRLTYLEMQKDLDENNASDGSGDLQREIDHARQKKHALRRKEI